MLRTIPGFVQRKRGAVCCLLLVRRPRSIFLTLTLEAVQTSTNIGVSYRATRITLILFSTATSSIPTREIIFSTVPEVNTEEA
jgi:hypothetical protein